MGRKTSIFLIYENILKSSATVRSEGTEKHQNKASYNIDYIVPNLIDFFVRWLKRDQNAHWKKKCL